MLGEDVIEDAGNTVAGCVQDVVPMKTVFLDGDSLEPGDLDLGVLERCVPNLSLYGATAPDETLSRVLGCEAVIVNKVELTEEILAAAVPRGLRLIVVAATGVNNVDLQAARDLGVTVCNCRAYGTESVAQHALALMLNLFTHIPEYREDVRRGEWCRSKGFCLLNRPIREAAGKRLGIVGYGTLGRRFAELASAMGMEVWISERSGGVTAREGRVPFPELVRAVDVLSLHCPLTEATARLIDTDVLHAMRADAVLINTARGGLVDEEALADALRRGVIGGAGIDVLSAEPPATDHPLLAPDIPNLLVTPHCAWGSRDARQRIVDQIAEALHAYMASSPVRVVEPVTAH